jgi:hypothetical protein
MNQNTKQQEHICSDLQWKQALMTLETLNELLRPTKVP